MRQYLTLKTKRSLLTAFGDLSSLHQRTLDLLQTHKAPSAVALALASLKVESSPSTGLRWTIENEPATHDEFVEQVVSISLNGPKAINELRHFLISQSGLAGLSEETDAILPEDGDSILLNIGADPRGHICALFPAAPARTFGNRGRVRELMRTGALRGLDGYGVNVVILDQGLNEKEISERHPDNWGGGLVSANGIEPGSAPRTSHGMMIARNVLDFAPRARLYDVPLIPPRVAQANVFASTAHAVYRAVIDKIKQLKAQSGPNTAWVLVNAWGIFDRSGEWPEGDYTRNTHMELSKPALGRAVWEMGHPFNRLMSRATKDEQIDVVFGAGNCGQFTSATRCGRLDRGEGRSIWGANAHPAVLTVGAVTTNGDWIGYSSQGPAAWGKSPDLDGRQKPDLCAPSNFHEDDDSSAVNSGTSAAAGLAAGVIAAIRSNPAWGPQALPPEKLKAAMNATAGGQDSGWNARTGHGMLDASALLRHLSPARATA